MNGTVDLRLSLWTADTGSGAQIGTTQLVTNVPVTNGLFTTTLNAANEFGPFPFDGATKYLQIAVINPSGSGSTVTLSPRQPIGAAPSAKSLDGTSRIAGTVISAVVAPSASFGVNGSSSVWQSFTPTVTGPMTSISVMLDRNSTVGSISQFTLYEGQGRGGSLLATSGQVTIPAVASGVFTFVFGTAPVLQAGQTYTIGYNGSTSTRWFYDNTNPYAGGQANNAAYDFSLVVKSQTTTPSALNVASDLAINSSISAGALTVGTYQGGTLGSLVNSYQKQAVLSGAWNTPPNSGNAVKLLIADYDNEPGSDVFPIYVEDENNITDFYLRVASGSRTAFIGPALGLGTEPTSDQLTVGGNATISGNLGIGASSASDKLTVGGSASISGKLGVGTSTAPAIDFQVGNGTGSPVIGLVGNGSALRFITTGGRNFIQSGTSLSASAADLAFTSVNNGTEWMRITAATGNIGIGRASSGYRLDVACDATNTNVANFTSQADFGSVVAVTCNVTGGKNFSLISSGPTGPGGLGAFNIRDVSANSDRLTILPNGNIGINSINPTQRLTVGGNILATGSITPSSRRYKENVRPIADALARVSKLEGVHFDWKPEYAEGRASIHDLGFIAEEVEKQFPEVIYRDPQGQVIGMDYARLSAVAVQALNQLKAEKDREIAELKSRLDRLEAASRSSATVPSEK